MAASVLKDTDVVLTPERVKEITAPKGNGLSDSYNRMVTEFPEQYGYVLRRLAHGPLPAVTHCTAGKDRTGVFSAVLLTILRVPRNLVIEDYMLTGEYMLTNEALRRASADWQKMTGSSEPPSTETLRNVYTMHEEALIGTFDTITRVYGSFDGFVRDGLKLTPTDVAALRTRLLE
jgi:protein-tyrosine phosphatase